MNEYVGPPAFCARSCSNVPSRSQRSSTRCSSATWSGSAGTGAKAGSAGRRHRIDGSRAPWCAVTRQRGYHDHPSGPWLLMRRRPHVLVLVLGAAAALLLSAPALSAPPPLVAGAAGADGDAGHPAQPGDRDRPADPALRVVVADDGNAGAAVPAHRHGERRPTGGAAWSAAAGRSRTRARHRAGQADVAWGVDARRPSRNVYLVETGAATGGGLCSTDARHPLLGLRGRRRHLRHAAAGRPRLELAGAVDRAPVGAGDRDRRPHLRRLHRAQVGRRELQRSADSRSIRLIYSDDERRHTGRRRGGSRRSRPRRPLPESLGAQSPRRPRRSSPSATTRRRARRSRPRRARRSPRPPATLLRRRARPPSVRARSSATRPPPRVVSGVAGPPTPSVIAAGGRVVVAWHASAGADVRAFAAMSTDNGATLRTGQQIDPHRAREPGRAASSPRPPPGGSTSPTSGTRAAAACRRRPSRRTRRSRAPRPRPGRSPSSCRGSRRRLRPRSSASPRHSDAASASRRRTCPASPLPATVVAFTDTSAGGQDVHVDGPPARHDRARRSPRRP